MFLGCSLPPTYMSNEHFEIKKINIYTIWNISDFYITKICTEKAELMATTTVGFWLES